MLQGTMTIVGAGEQECSFCGKDKEGVAVDIDGAESFLCWPDLRKLVRLKATSKPRPEPLTPAFPAMNGCEA